MIDSKQFEELIQKQLTQAINNNIEQYVQTLIVDKTFLTNIQRQLVATLQSAVKKRTSELNVDGEVKKLLTEMFADYATTLSFDGINLTATETELSIMPGAVVAENNLVAKNIQAEDSIKTEHLIVTSGLAGAGVKSLEQSIAESVYNQMLDQAVDTIADTVLDRAKSGIDFSSVRIDGSMLVENNTLSPKIRSIGPLDSLTVSGDIAIRNTLVVKKDRVGINTDEPSMSLDLWDEEVQVSIGKKKERTAFVGSSRLQNLEIGVNGRGNITITDNNLVVIENLQVDKNRISWGSEVPGFSGSKGDIVYNTNISPEKPVFAWMCSGGFNWIALSANPS